MTDNTNECFKEGYEQGKFDTQVEGHLYNWHKYPDEKPKGGDRCLCCCKYKWGDSPEYHLNIYCYSNKKGSMSDYEWKGKGFYEYDSEWGECLIDNVVAWTELPEIPSWL